MREGRPRGDKSNDITKVFSTVLNGNFGSNGGTGDDPFFRLFFSLVAWNSITFEKHELLVVTLTE